MFHSLHFINKLNEIILETIKKKNLSSLENFIYLFFFCKILSYWRYARKRLLITFMIVFRKKNFFLYSFLKKKNLLTFSFITIIRGYCCRYLHFFFSLRMAWWIKTQNLIKTSGKSSRMLFNFFKFILNLEYQILPWGLK